MRPFQSMWFLVNFPCPEKYGTYSIKSAFSFWLVGKLQSCLPTVASDLNDQASIDIGKSLNEVFSAVSQAPKIPIFTVIISQRWVSGVHSLCQRSVLTASKVTLTKLHSAGYGKPLSSVWLLVLTPCHGTPSSSLC